MSRLQILAAMARLLPEGTSLVLVSDIDSPNPEGERLTDGQVVKLSAAETRAEMDRAFERDLRPGRVDIKAELPIVRQRQKFPRPPMNLRKKGR